MSSPKKIRRWNRFEIAFNQEDWANKALCKADWRQTPDKMQGGRKIEEKTVEENDPNLRASTQRKSQLKRDASAAKSPLLDDWTLKTAFEPASEALWTEARREKAEEGKKWAEAPLKSMRQEKLSPEKSGFPTRNRPRTFRLCESPRRFDRLRRDQEEDEQN